MLGVRDDKRSTGWWSALVLGNETSYLRTDLVERFRPHEMPLVEERASVWYTPAGAVDRVVNVDVSPVVVPVEDDDMS